jgi:hypothetical protein
MLTISPQIADALEVYSRPGFARDLCVELADKYPHFLPRFPEAVQLRIVSNMLARASGWGLDRQDALTAYCEYMIVIAANFDEEPEIRHALQANRGDLNLLIPVLPEFVSEVAWDRAEAAGSSLPFFVNPRFDGQSLPQRSAEAVKVALFDRPEAQAPDAAVARAAAEAQARGLDRETDALLVLAACHSFYGAAPLWLDELARERWSSGAIIEAIRLRLALDSGRYL